MLEPLADGFRNYVQADYGVVAEVLLVDKAQLLTLTGSNTKTALGPMYPERLLFGSKARVRVAWRLSEKPLLGHHTMPCFGRRFLRVQRAFGHTLG